jgi:hypothetical protein
MKRALAKALFLLAVFMALGQIIFAHAANDGKNTKAGITYYVDRNGNDLNKGTSPNSAFKNIDRLNTIEFKPGDRILLKSGCVWLGQEFRPKGSGTEENPIYLGKYGGDRKPAINGSGYETAIFLHSIAFWIIEDLELANDDTLPYYTDIEPAADNGEVADIRAGIQSLGYTGKMGQNPACALSPVNVETGVDYTLALWTQGEGSITVKAVNPNTNATIASVQTTPTENWAESVLAFNSGNNKAVLVLIYGEESDKTLYIDDFSLKMDGDLQELLDDPGFEHSGWELEQSGFEYTKKLGLINERKRSGIRLLGENGDGALSGIALRRLELHSVLGKSNHNDQWYNASILVETLNDESKRGTVPYYKDLLIEDCYIHDTSTYGIYIKNGADNWHKHEGVIIRHVVTRNTGVDGINVGYCESPLIENCAVYNAGSSRYAKWCAGLWTFGCHNSVIQYCEVAGTKYTGDSMAFDMDINDTGTNVVQHCYSHDNAGGFIMIIDESYSDLNLVRYNISQNDGTESAMPAIIKIMAGNNYFYNNVIYNDRKTDGVVIYNYKDAGKNTIFENNIFYAIRDIKYPDMGSEADFLFNKNVYYGHNAQVNDANKLTLDPMLANPGGAGDGMESCSAYKLQKDSPYIEEGDIITTDDIMKLFPAANRSIVDIGAGRDFFGSALPNGANPSIGVHEAYSSGVFNQIGYVILALFVLVFAAIIVIRKAVVCKTRRSV